MLVLTDLSSLNLIVFRLLRIIASFQTQADAAKLWRAKKIDFYTLGWFS